MNNLNVSFAETNKTIEDQYNELFKLAEKTYPTLMDSINSFNGLINENTAFSKYLDLVNQTPKEISTNQISL